MNSIIAYMDKANYLVSRLDKEKLSKQETLDLLDLLSQSISSVQKYIYSEKHYVERNDCF